jgi:hypothetical protein
VTTSVAWTFRKAPKFFDVVQYTGNGATRDIPHSLGSVPGLIIIKSSSGGGAGFSWLVHYRPLNRIFFSFATGGSIAQSGYFGTHTSSTFNVVGDTQSVNRSPETYIAYLFAHNAGGFGLTGTDSVVSCGSYTGTAATLQVNCGFPVRFLMIKRSDSTGAWFIWDTARGIVSGNDGYLAANDASAEVTTNNYINPYSLGFEVSSTAPIALNASGGTYIYLAIA